MTFEMLPVFAEGAARWLHGVIKPDWKVFEYGASACTEFLVKRGVKPISIEHEPIWCDLIKGIKIKVIPPQSCTSSYSYGADTYTSKDWDLRNFNLERYVKYIDRFPNAYFNMIIINGRARASCIKHALPKICSSYDPGDHLPGYLLLDDAQKPEYQDTIDHYLKEKSSIMFQEGRKMTKIWII